MIRYLVLTAAFATWVCGCAPLHWAVPGKDMNSVTFFLTMPAAARVEFASSMDDFTMHEVKKNGSGIWETVLPFHTEFRYFYRVDGAFYIPDCPCRETDDLGSQNCIYVPEKP